MSLIDRFFCLLNRHLWQDEGSDYQEGWLLRARCCGRIKVLKPKDSDWKVTHREPAKSYSTGSGVITIGEQVSKRLDSPEWWLPHMKHQRWEKCAVRNCGVGIRSAASSLFCEFHHRHIEVDHDFSESTLRQCGIKNPEQYLKARES